MAECDAGAEFVDTGGDDVGEGEATGVSIEDGSIEARVEGVVDGQELFGGGGRVSRNWRGRRADEPPSDENGSIVSGSVDCGGGGEGVLVEGGGR